MSVLARDRVLTSLAHEQPDVTPWQINPTIDAYKRLVEYTGDPDYISKIGNHLASYEDGWFKEERPDFWRDQFGVLWNRTIDKDIGNVEGLMFPEPDMSVYTFPDPDLERNDRYLSELVADNPTKFRVASVGFSMFERAWTLRGMENLLMDMVIDPDFVDALMDRILEYNLKVIDHFVTYDIDCIRFGDDWGQQRGLITGPRLWRRFIKPRVAAMYARVKEHGLYVMQHSCGDIQELFPDLIDMGLDIFETFQPEVMDPGLMKQKYGDHITFYGGISTQQVLPKVSPEELVPHIREMIALVGANGGYIVAPTHGVPWDVPPENLVAFVETVQAQ